MNRVYCCFPGGKHKALTMSYDDGRLEDRRLIEIFNRNGIRGTFHLNSGLWEGDARRIQPEEIAELRAKTPRFFLSIRRAKRGVCFSFFQFFFISACMCTGRLRCIRYTTSHAAFSACAPRHSVRDTAARAAHVPCRRTR